MDPSHNLNALLIGTGEFSFCEGATTASEALIKGYLDVGNVRAFTPTIEVQRQVHKGSYRGRLRKDKSIVTEQNLDYLLRLDEWSEGVLKFLFGASATSEFVQAALSAEACDAWAFTSDVPAVAGKWYQITDGGVPLMHVTTVTIATLTEGTDFFVDQKLGRVRFAAAQTATRTPTVTAAAITTGTAKSMFGLLPLETLTRRGVGRLVLFDQGTEIIVLDHRDFVCDVSVENSGEVNGENWTEIQLRVSIDASSRGTVYGRRANA